MHEHARQIVDELQRQRRNDEIESGGRERQRLLVGDDEAPCISVFVRTLRVGCHDGADRRHAGERPAQNVGRGAEIERAIEPPQHGGEPLGEIGGGAIEQKRFRTSRRGTAPARTQQMAIEDQWALRLGRLGHG